MKQSTKLLSFVLALIMAFSCFSVVGNAALVKEQVYWDSVDDAILSPEQVADIALDLVDGLLASGGDDMNIDLAGIITLDLRSVDTALRDICDLGLGTLLGFAGGILDLGALENLDFGPLSTDGKSKGKPWQRSHGDLVVIRQLLQFLNNNAGVISPAVRGINVDGGLDLGMIGSFLGDMGEINDILQNLPSFVKEMVFDMLIHGSYNASYADESFPSAEELGSLPANVDTLAEIADYAIGSLLSNPQDYEWVDTDGDGIKETKRWDTNAKLLPTAAAYGFDVVADYFSVLGTDFNANNGVDATQNTIFQILDKAAPFAIYDLGIPALNHNLKKGLMEAVEADINECDAKDVPAEVMAVFNNEAAYVTYIGYDCMSKSNDGEWFYSTLESETLVDANDNPILDADGNEQSHKVRKYFKVNMASANEFAALINWDWNLYAPVPLSGDITQDDINEINYEALIATYGTITESLNDIIGVVYQNALTEEVKADFEDVTGDAWITGATSDVFNYNIERLLKYLLANFAGKIFGEDSAYADKDTYDYSFYEPMSLIDIVALIGPSFFEDVMPQLIIPKNEDGTYAFAPTEDGESVAFLQFGAIVLREFVSDITPNINYDEFIYADGSLTDGSGRQFADHTAEEWFNIILNMGVDIGYSYLYQITNFGDNIDYDANGIALDTSKFSHRTTDVPEAPTAETVVTEARWKGMLNTAIEWAVNYVGQGSDGVLKGLDPNSVTAVKDPLDKLSYVLNTLLPLGFINGLEDGTYDVSVSVLFDRLKVFLTKFDFNQLVALFGRNGVAAAGDDSTLVKGNILNQPVQEMAINLINNILGLVFQRNILATKDNNDATPTTLDGVIEHVALQRTVENIIRGLYGVHAPLLRAALPVVGKFIKGWGTEQSFGTPDISISSHLALNSGATSEAQAVTVKNKADGVWRSWIDASGTRYTDEQYQIKITGVKAYDFAGNPITSGFSTSNLDTTNFIPYGKSSTYNYSLSGFTTNQFIRIDTSYQVYEGTTLMTNDTYVISNYIYLDNTTTDAGAETNTGNDGRGVNWGYHKTYVDLSNMPNSAADQGMIWWYRSKETATGHTFINMNGTADGLTFSLANMEMNNGNRDWKNVSIYGTNDRTPGGDDSDKEVDQHTAHITATFDKAAWEKLEKKSGDIGNFKVNVSGVKKPYTALGSDKSYTGTIEGTFTYYDGAAQNELASDISKELKLGKLAADYNATGVSYADTLLTYTTYTDEDGEEVKKNTNFEATAWLDADGEVVTATVTPSADDENVGTYKVGDVTYTAKKVTVIDNTKVWSNYVNALDRAANAAYTAFRAGSDFDYEGAMVALNSAVTDLGFAKASAVANPAVSTAIGNLKTKLDNVENTYTDNYDYTDYKMHRLNRLNDARDEARWLVDLKKDASYKMADIDSNFPYNGMTEADINAIIAANPSKLNLVGGKDNANLVAALLEELSAEEYASREQWLEDRQLEFAGLTTFDVAYASDMLTKTSSRLLNRSYKVNGEPNFGYINAEIASAEAEIDADNMDEDGNQIYTDRSWAKYTAALKVAKDVVAGANGQVKSQKNAFDAKWELLCCRNELVPVELEADYSELENLIAQAEQVMANLSLYDNSAKELGQVLAELGVKGLVNADGDDIDIFPGSAYHVNTEPYTVDDQDIIDGKANELKEALARLKFYNLSITGDVAVADKTIIAADEEAGIEAVIAKIATIAPEMNAADVKDLFTVGATGANVSKENITVSNDLHYTVETELAGFAGTNSVVTFYTVKGDIKIPVATVRLVVNGDINGDGVVDVIDGANAFLVSTDKAALDGCYFIAGNLAGEAEVGKGVIDANDYSALINLVVA